MNPTTPPLDEPTSGSSEPSRLAEPVGHENPARLPFVVVGIGAGAGGLEALVDFFRVLRNDTGIAYVVVLHLSPAEESKVKEILSGQTGLLVLEAEEGMEVEPNHVYLISRGRSLKLHEGHLRLAEVAANRDHAGQIDDFFRSLAEEQQERAVGIVLSGMGSDGTAGVQAIKAVGGMCIAQEPDSAEFPWLPRVIIETGCADFILKTEDMPEVLERYNQHPCAMGEGPEKNQSKQDQSAYADIVAIVRSRARIDFSGYKQATLLRRMERRMSLGQILTLCEYVRVLRQNASEVAALSDDMMIHVTGFFRDPEIWEAIQEKVIAPLIHERPENSPIRAWVTACASGEEAYTLAMLLLETAETAGKNFQFKLFATDTAERSLSFARAGVYPAGIASEITPSRLARFFDKDNSVYRIKRELREIVVFAEQNLLQDPPFSRLDICTCRNLLIYLKPEVQQRALAMVHFGLRDGGALVLGNSETAAGSEELFEPVDKKNRIFKRIGASRHGLVDFNPARPPAYTQNGRVAVGLTHSAVAQLTQKTLLERFSPPSVVIDRQQRMVHFQGATERYLDQPRGEPTQEILSLVREPFRGAVRSAVQKALEHNTSATFRGGIIITPEGPARIAVTVAPLDSGSAAALFLVSFQSHPEPSAEASSSLSRADADAPPLVKELQVVREELQNVIRELQTSNEGLRASNQETVSVNEELQSTNEELETNKEELQSLNEELSTVNAQLQLKLEELESTTNDLSSLLSSTSIGVLFLDVQFRIRRFTPAVKDLLDLIPADVGRPLSDLARKFSDNELLSDATNVLAHLVPLEKEVWSDSDRVYLRRILPYRINDQIEGVVITFIEVTELKKAEIELRISEERHRLIIQGVQDYAIFMLDPAGKIITWSPAAERLLGYTSADALEQDFSLILTPDDRAGGLVEREMTAATKRDSIQEEHWYVRRDQTRFWGAGTLSALRAPDGTLRGFAKMLRDNTERKITEDALQIAKHSAEAANDAKDEFLANVSHELRTPLSAMLLWARMLEEDGYADPVQVKAGLDIIRACAIEQQELIEDLVDTSRIASGKLVLELKPVELRLVVQNPLSTIRLSAAAKKITVLDEVDPAAGFVMADQKRLQQIVSNLLTNAVKFTPIGGLVACTLKRQGDEVLIEVSDNGIGISPDFVPHIFERFRQAANATTRISSGLGLGLAITQQLVALHGGTISVQSPGAGKGAKFTVRLALPAIDPGEPVVRDSSSPFKGDSAIKGRRILLIEDSNNTRDALSALLRKAGAEVVDFATATPAIAEFQRRRPDYIVSDLGLPRVDGHDLMRFLRSWEKDHRVGRVPALAVTAYADEKNRRKALECGFDKVLTKPIEPDQVLRALAGLPLARQRVGEK